MATKTKKEEIIDLAKPVNITKEELSTLQATIRNMDRLTSDIGRIELQKMTILGSVEEVQKNIQDLRDKFLNIYGTDNVNIQTGELAYPKPKDDVKADS